MRNTAITYGSDKQKPQILQEFADLLPALTEEQTFCRTAAIRLS